MASIQSYWSAPRGVSVRIPLVVVMAQIAHKDEGEAAGCQRGNRKRDQNDVLGAHGVSPPHLRVQHKTTQSPPELVS